MINESPQCGLFYVLIIEDVWYFFQEKLEMKNYEVILWDVDDTLLDFGLSQDYALKKSFAKYGIEIDEEIVNRYTSINQSFWERLERGEISKKEVLYGRFTSLFKTMSITDIDVTEFKDYYQKELGSVYFYRDNSYQLCKELSSDFKQYIVTNGVTATQQNKLLLSGFDKLMNGIFISEQLGSPKPTLAFFEKCLEQFSYKTKSKILIVGDSLTSDMKGGNNIGITCCWYNPQNKEKNIDVNIDFEIKHLWDVKEILYG